MPATRLKNCAACSGPIQKTPSDRIHPSHYLSKRFCSVSCASRKNKTIHGGAGNRARWYRSWEAAKARCLNENNSEWTNYGRRGIRMCERWLNNPGTFLKDMGEPPRGYSIDRINNDGDYEPKNCHWASPSEQARNRRSSRTLIHNGANRNLVEWAKVTGIGACTISMRIDKYGWSVKRALTTPVPPHKSRGITFRGKTQGGRAWAKETRIHRTTILARLRKGWSVEKSLTTPTKKSRKK